jgi:hypothetical protein
MLPKRAAILRGLAVLWPQEVVSGGREMASFSATMTQCLWAENSSDGFENWLNRLAVLALKAVVPMPRLGRQKRSVVHLICGGSENRVIRTYVATGFEMPHNGILPFCSDLGWRRQRASHRFARFVFQRLNRNHGISTGR